MEQDTLYRQFLEWYNSQYGAKYFSEANQPSGFKLVDASEPDKLLAFGIGALQITDDTRAHFGYWQTLLPEMGRDLESNGAAGEFAIHLPRFTFKPDDVVEFRTTFAAVVAARLKTLEGNNFADIGEYMADKFPAWPRLPSLDMIEFHQWGMYGRPDELLVQRMPGNGRKLTLLVSPTEVFTFDSGKIVVVEHLKAAKAKGAMKTILLFAGKLPVDEEILKSSLPLLNKDLLSGADEIYICDLDRFSAIRIQ